MNQFKAQKWIICALAAGLLTTVNAYERIVSATGNASEVIAELGLADKLVAVDTTSTLPADVMKDKPTIGYRRMLSSEGILSKAPDLLILAPDAGAPAAIKQLKQSGLKIITIEDKKTLDGIVADIELIAKTLDVSDKAAPIIQAIRDDEASIKKHIAKYSRPPKIAFFLDGGIGRFMGLGADTAGDGMITIVGGENIFAKDFKSVKPLSLESLAVTDVDMIIIASHGKKIDNSEKVLEKALKKYPKLAITQAGKKDCVFTVGIVEALGFGPHLTTTAKQIVEAVPPCINKAKTEESK